MDIKSIHSQLLEYLNDLGSSETSIIVGYNVGFKTHNKFYFEIAKSNKMFLFDQKRIISKALELKAKEVSLFKFSKFTEDEVSKKEIMKITSFRALLIYFDLQFGIYYVFDSKNIRKINLDN